jgi:hypothetical protein
MRVGGRDPKTHEYGGIHWHVSSNARIEYEQLDGKRSKIGTIRVYDGDKLVSEYLPREQDRGLKVVEKRTMDCVDCHNRPTHVFDESPAAAVDRAMAGGQLDAKTPFLVATSRAVLSSPPSDGNFRAALEAAYRSSHPDVKVEPATLDQAGKALAELYSRNVYPKMNVSWGTYRSRLGHKHEGDKGDEIGCFRCHDNEHEKRLASGGTKRLRQSCEECHEQLVAGEDPAKLEAELKQLLPR